MKNRPLRSFAFVLSFAAFALATSAIGLPRFVNAQSVGVTLPSVPTGVSASTGSTPSQVSVTWSASTESSGTVEGYYVYRNGAQIANTAGTSITDTVTPGLYEYTVAAYDANNNVSAQSSPASLSVVADTTPPTTPTGVTVTGPTSTNSYYNATTLTISWNPSSDNVGVAGYYVYRNGVNITSSTAALTGTSITDTVTPGMYTYTVVAYDASQNFSARSAPATVTITVDSTPPSVPADVSVQQTGTNSVNVSWASSTDPVGVAGYQVFRDGTQIASAAGSPYSDGSVSTGQTYSYQVAAYDNAGNISNESSPPASVTIQTVSGPQAPYGLSGILSGTSSVALSWGPSVDTLAITGYSVYRDGSQIATVTSTNLLDIGLASGTYAYTVSATDVSGAVSPMSATTTVAVPPFVPSAAPTPVLPSPVVGPAPSSIPSVPSAISPTTESIIGSLTQSLYYGLRGGQVTTLQSLLAENGYLAPIDETGFFGNLTRAAVEKFQCAESVVCTGGPGWGLVGPKTRAALNALLGNSTTSISVSLSASSSVSQSSLESELQTLETELAALEAQAKQ